tara:strand:- start:3042 stop:3401 length:360 start_codon:yes stop_codon:yes gene_type:complete
MDEITKTIEKQYPECTDELMRNFDRAYELWCQKQSDYGDSNIRLGLNLSSFSSESSQNNRLAQLGIVIRMNDKICRLVNLYKKDSIETSAVKESIEDTSTDIMNYANMLMVLRAGKWGK